MVAGVASGIATYFEVDPTLVRLAWVIAGLSGFGVIAYIIAAIIVPESPYEYGATPSAAPTDHGMPAERPNGTPGESGSTPEREDRIPQIPVAPPHSGGSGGTRSFGYILVGLGIILVARRVIPWFHIDRLWPVVLILIGAYLVAGGSRSAK